MVKTTGCKKVASGWMTQMHSFSGESFANFEALNQCYSDVYLRLVFYQEAIYIYVHLYARYNNTDSPDNKNNNSSKSHNNKKEYFYLIIANHSDHNHTYIKQLYTQ